MPKVKSCSAAKKRFRINKNRLIKRASAYRSHLLTKKSSGRKRNLRKVTYVSAVDSKAIYKLLPYS